MSRWRLIPLLAALAVNAYAHAGEPPEPHDLWGAWSLDPGVVVPLALTAILFAAGAKKSRGVSATQAACFWLGWLVLAVALISPLHRLGEALFSAHMAQHEFLMLLAAPLLVLSRPLIPDTLGPAYTMAASARSMVEKAFGHAILACDYAACGGLVCTRRCAVAMACTAIVSSHALQRLDPLGAAHQFPRSQRSCSGGLYSTRMAGPATDRAFCIFSPPRFTPAFSEPCSRLPVRLGIRPTPRRRRLGGFRLWKINRSAV